MNGARETGRRGEDIACRFLEYKGFEIIRRNYVKPYGEIDIIARDGEYIVFVEVKTRRDAKFSRAADAVSRSKIEKLRRTALLWLSENGASDEPARFDVIEVYTGAEPAKVRHIRNTF